MILSGVGVFCVGSRFAWCFFELVFFFDEPAAELEPLFELGALEVPEPLACCDRALARAHAARKLTASAGIFFIMPTF